MPVLFIQPFITLLWCGIASGDVLTHRAGVIFSDARPRAADKDQIAARSIVGVVAEVIVLAQIGGMVTRGFIERGHALIRRQAAIGAFEVDQIDHLLFVIRIDDGLIDPAAAGKIQAHRVAANCRSA